MTNDQYAVWKNKDLVQLAKDVNISLKTGGWTLQGGIAVRTFPDGSVEYLQALFRKA